MPQLSKATLQEIDNANQPRAGRPAVVVQFNPASLRLQYANHSEGGRSAGRSARQHTGEGALTLTVELVFDTADEGSTDAPRSVLEHTRRIEAFIKPQAAAGRHQAPPRLRFHWGDVIVDGVLESLSIDIDHFAHTGTPLRAKASLSIKGQDPERQANRSGAGANTASGQPATGNAAATPAQPGAGAAAGLSASLSASLGGGLLGGLGAGLGAALQAGSVLRALDGESLPQLATRAGLAPEAWRALGTGVADPSRVPAGREIAVPDAAQAGPGAGATRGVQSGTQGAAATGAAQRVGLETDTATAAGSALRQGYALAAAGGLGAALETVKADAGQRGALQARRRFEGAGGAITVQPDPLTAAATTPGQRQQVFSLRADPRAMSFGRDVPLRDRIGQAQDERANLLSGQAVLRRQPGLLPPRTRDPAVPGWVALPEADVSAATRPHARHCRGGLRCRCR